MDESDSLEPFCTCRPTSFRRFSVPGYAASADRSSGVCSERWLTPTEGPTLGGRIVVGVDGSPPSARALKWALNQGALTGAAVEAVNAWQVPQVPGGRISAMGVDLSAMSKEILQNAVAAVGASAESVTERAVEGHLSRFSSTPPTVPIS